MGGLSQNVLNMKFMRGSDNKELEKNEPTTYKKVKDTSEWYLPNRGQVQQRLKSAVKVKSVGYGSIASMTAEPKEEEDKKEEQAVPKKVEKDPKAQADEFLQDIMGKPKKDKKRKLDSSAENHSKKKKKKKSKQ
ncbi:hypothetical protein ACI3LY_000032 [Candidozyma auris]|nr:hypothetical_protein [[Candida] auris]KNE00109.1 hypothetical protein QG37_03058 [[Candida] auris]PIS57987.1 hypothetical protein CJI97_001043 [[Candida] auris]PIS58523.1 hypothetical protein B9J08_001023 [[Candida] auris]QEO20594.1 hypothetical_protein [[Candida] auris]GBL49434.1 hypothetical protein CAJCM15448_17080 [[Candida] auris]